MHLCADVTLSGRIATAGTRTARARCAARQHAGRSFRGSRARLGSVYALRRHQGATTRLSAGLLCGGLAAAASRSTATACFATVHIDNLVDAVVDALAGDVAGRAYYVTDSGFSMRGGIRHALKACDLPPRARQRAPRREPRARLGARRPQRGAAHRRGASRIGLVDVSRASRDLGWKARVSVAKGMARSQTGSGRRAARNDRSICTGGFETRPLQ